MNQVKKILGLVWMILAPLVVFYLIKTASAQIAAKPTIDTKIQWGVFVFIFIPIAVGLLIFGYYAWNNEYDQLPESSAEIKD
jgi:hypothetical protein